MTPRMSIIGASIRKLFATGIGGNGDYYWDNVVLATHLNTVNYTDWSQTVLAMHMNERDPYWSSVVLALHMDHDPYWSNTVLALHMDGANDGTTFTDEKGKTITRYGNTVTKTATKKFGTASAYFDGVGDYLTAPYSTDFDFGTGDFTIEGWVYPTGDSNGERWQLYSAGYRNTTIGGYSIRGTSNTIVFERVYVGGSEVTQGSIDFSLNTWYHVVVCRNSSGIMFFVNGAKISASATFIGSNLIAYSNPVTIGGSGSGGGSAAYWAHTGYIDDLRVTKGVCRYTKNFYPLQRAFTDAKIPDETGKVVTPYGNATLSTTQKKFGPTSAYFDGSGDRFAVPMSSDFDFGSGDWTVEFWYYPISAVASDRVMQTRDGDVAPGIYISHNTATQIQCYCSITGSGFYGAGLNINLTQNTWQHIAIVRTGTTVKAYLNGKKEGSNYSVVGALYYNVADTMVIGGQSAGRTINGYLDDFRITKGVCRYTGNFEPPLSAFLDETRTPKFYDELGNPFNVAGTPSLTVSNVKFGTNSASFGGTTDFIRAPDTVDFGFGNDNFTVECWVRTAASGTILDFRKYSTDLGLFAINSGKASIWNRSAHLLGITDLTTSTWFHLAWVRNNGLVSLYVNGKVEACSLSTGDYGIARPCTIGADYTTTGANFFNGLIDDVRVTKGLAKYIGKFTPPNYSFQDPINRVLFLDEKGKTITGSGNVVTSVPPRFGDASGIFDGTTDFLSVANSTDFQFGSGEFTMEAWLYLSGTPSDSKIIFNMRAGSGTTDASYAFYYAYPSAALAFVYSTDGTTLTTALGTATISANTWHHVVVQRSVNTIRFFIDGVEDTSITNSAFSGTLFNSTSAFTIGANTDGSKSLSGNIDEILITKGVAKYSASFNPNTKQFPNYLQTYNSDPYFNNVVLGLHMDGTDTGTTFTDVKGKTVTANGGAQTKTATKKFGTASAYFDGTGDFLSVADSDDWAFAGGDFTIECWVNPTSFAASIATIVGQWGAATYCSWILHTYTSGQLTFGYSTNGSFQSGNDLTVASALVAGVWSHVTVSRVGNSIYMLVNGKLIGTKDITGLGPLANVPQALIIGSNGNSEAFTGYIDDLRITKGVGRYSTDFKPVLYPFPDQTAPLDVQVSDAYWDDVTLAMHMDGADSGVVFTELKGRSITVVGNTQTKTATKKFGTASAYFDGVGDYLTVSNGGAFDFGTGDFTVETWVNFAAYSASFSGEYGACLFATYLTNSGNNSGWQFRIDGSATAYHTLNIWTGTTQHLITIPALSLNIWHHVAISRTGGVLRAFLNGVQVGGNIATTDLFTRLGNTELYVGKLNDATYGLTLNGYLDDCRITKGVGRYTTNFNPPGLFPEKYPEIYNQWSNTVLAMHMNGADNGTVFTDEKGKTVTRYNAVTKTGTKKFGLSSAYFDGTGDYLTVPHSTDFDFGSGDFTIEFWINFPANPSVAFGLLSKRASDAVYSPFHLSIDSPLTINCRVSLTGAAWVTTTATGLTVNTWTHVAFVRFGGYIVLFINGVSISTSSVSTTALMTNTTDVTIGANSIAADYLYTGYMDELQILKGVARYQANFIPPVREYPNG